MLPLNFFLTIALGLCSTLHSQKYFHVHFLNSHKRNFRAKMDLIDHSVHKDLSFCLSCHVT